ncbi:MAG: multiheme c-type cytochrome [Myxococcota bacterium]
MSVFVWIWSAIASANGPFVLDGTQPHELQVPLDSAQSCAVCHGGYEAATFDAWRGTLMANAVVDPVFLAALTVAEQDSPGSGEFCLRCHTPNAWLEGRCLPGDGSALTASDLASGVSCDACHRMTEVDGGLFISNAQYTYDNDPSKRGLLGSNDATHAVTYDPLQASSDLCGVCHEVSNPALDDFPIELTWTEWSQSAFVQEGVHCQDCHMKVVKGYAASNSGLEPRTLHEHRFVGGNAWVPEVLAATATDPDRAASLRETAAAARELHHEAATITIMPVGTPMEGQRTEWIVAVENRTGHKLPSGYPEGRRAWLEVTIDDAAGNRLLHSGAYDLDTAELQVDDQLRTYQALLGSNGVQSYHMVTQDQLLEDTRIPPRGFRPSSATEPVGRTYATRPDGTLSHIDDAPYVIQMPEGATGPVTVTATLWYQTTTKDFVTFLRDVNVTDDRGTVLYDLWETYDRCPPDEVARAEATFEVLPRPIDVVDPVVPNPGCGCDQGTPIALWLGLLGLFATGRRSTPKRKKTR